MIRGSHLHVKFMELQHDEKVQQTEEITSNEATSTKSQHHIMLSPPTVGSVVSGGAMAKDRLSPHRAPWS